MMTFLKPLLQEIIIIIFRPLLIKEVWGWGKIYKIFIGDYYKRNWFWKGAKKRVIKGKLNNSLMELDISDWSDRSTFFLGRWYDLPIQKLIEQVLKKGDQVIDIGANVGMFSLAARELVGDSGFVYSFEPNPQPRDRFKRNLEINKFENIKVYSVGLGEVEGQFTLNVPYLNSGEGSLSSFSQKEYEGSEYYQVPVEIKVGDRLLAETKPRMIKIDVEGGEVNVLKGIPQLIKNNLPLIIAEYVPNHLSRFGHSFTDILSIAKEHSYKIFKLELAKTANSYDLVLTPIENADFAEPCDMLLGHQDDPYIQQVQNK